MPVRVLLVDAIEELQQALADVPGDGAHHAEVVVYEAPLLLRIDRNVSWVWVCTTPHALSDTAYVVMCQLVPCRCSARERGRCVTTAWLPVSRASSQQRYATQNAANEI